MEIRFEQNEQGERVKVTIYESGAEVRELDRDPPAAPPRRAEILAELAEIDRLGDSPRARREAALGNTAWLASLDADAAKLRAELATL